MTQAQGGWAGSWQVCLTTEGCVGRAVILSTTGNQIMLLLLTLVASRSLCLLPVSQKGSAFPLSGSSMEFLGVPFFDICLSLSHSSMSLLHWVM